MVANDQTLSYSTGVDEMVVVKILPRERARGKMLQSLRFEVVVAVDCVGTGAERAGKGAAHSRQSEPIRYRERKKGSQNGGRGGKLKGGCKV